MVLCRKAGQSIGFDGVSGLVGVLVELADAAADCSGCSDETGTEEHEGAGLGGGGGGGYVGCSDREVQGGLSLVEVDEEQVEGMGSSANCWCGAWCGALAVDSAIAADEISVDIDEGHIVGADVEGQRFRGPCGDIAGEG